MSLTEAIEEAYAANPKGAVIIETIELTHVSFAESFRVAVGVLEDIDLPLESGGGPVTFIACAMEVTPPGVNEDGPTPMKLRIGDPVGRLTPYLQSAVQTVSPIEITYRAYTTEDLSEPGDVHSGYYLTNVEQDAAGAEGTVVTREIALQAFPLMTYDAEKYPALQEG